jgi:hypothetical protein
MNVVETTDYELFKKFPGNRPLDSGNIKRLRQAILLDNRLPCKPIMVNGDMEVIDGQHRLEVAKQLELPIAYMQCVDASYTDIINLNYFKKSWTPSDFLRIFSEGRKLPDYLKLSQFMKENRIKLPIALLIIKGPMGLLEENQKFKTSRFKFSCSLEEAQELMDKIRWVWTLLESHNSQPMYKYKGTAFVKGLLIFLDFPDMDWSLAKHKFDLHYFKIGIRPTAQMYLEMLMEIYNLNNRNKRLLMTS